MSVRSIWLALAVLAVGRPALAQDVPPAPPESVGLSSEGLERVTAALQAHVDRGSIAGVVAAIVRDGKLVYSESLGYRDLEAQTPMPVDAIFLVSRRYAP